MASLTHPDVFKALKVNKKVLILKSPHDDCDLILDNFFENATLVRSCYAGQISATRCLATYRMEAYPDLLIVVEMYVGSCDGCMEKGYVEHKDTWINVIMNRLYIDTIDNANEYVAKKQAELLRFDGGHDWNYDYRSAHDSTAYRSDLDEIDNGPYTCSWCLEKWPSGSSIENIEPFGELTLCPICGCEIWDLVEDEPIHHDVWQATEEFVTQFRGKVADKSIEAKLCDQWLQRLQYKKAADAFKPTTEEKTNQQDGMQIGWDVQVLSLTEYERSWAPTPEEALPRTPEDDARVSGVPTSNTIVDVAQHGALRFQQELLDLPRYPYSIMPHPHSIVPWRTWNEPPYHDDAKTTREAH